ncbi:hypothetical protein, partial [Thiolapillus sp.]|uniref:hypothetical protein n=1 Tax=Thiolapillus sp. TaxID=2017437 RepID=UPI003AF7F5B8
VTRTAGAPIGCQRPSRFWGLGCPKIFHEAEDTLVSLAVVCHGRKALKIFPAVPVFPPFLEVKGICVDGDQSRPFLRG